MLDLESLDIKNISVENLSFSLEGEDRIAKSILRKAIEIHQKNDYFFIDIGSNHPQRINNTMLFVLMGFRGICVEPITKYNGLYKNIRPNDVLENKCITQKNEIKKLHVYQDDAASSMHDGTIERYDKKFKIVETKEVECMSYGSLLEKYNLENKCIPFVDVDVEGEDTNTFRQVVESLVKPMLICVENKLANLERSYPDTEIDSLAQRNGYTLISKTALNSFYIFKESASFDWIPRQMLHI